MARGRPLLGLTPAERIARRRMLQNARRAEQRKLDGPETPHYVVAPSEPPCPRALDERDRRLALQPRDLTARVCGDPPPGYSALEQRKLLTARLANRPRPTREEFLQDLGAPMLDENG